MKDHLKKAHQLGENYAKGVQAQTNSLKRYILCDMAPSNCGKSTVLNAVADYYDQLCNTTFSKITYFTLSNDRWLVVQEKSTGKVILIQTKGDDLGSYSRTLTYMLNTNNIPVDIIICACHPDDKTKDLVKKLAGNSFQLFYFGNFTPNCKKNWPQPSSQLVMDQMKDCIINIANQL